MMQKSINPKPVVTLGATLGVTLGATLGLLGCAAHSSPHPDANAATTSMAPPAATTAPPVALAAADRLDDCDVEGLDSETAFDGPGWDRARKMPRQAKDSYLVHTTVLVVRDDKAAQATFRELNAAMANQLLEHDGLVGFRVAGSTRCRTARTVAVWRDARSMRAFGPDPAHVGTSPPTPFDGRCHQSAQTGEGGTMTEGQPQTHR